MAPLKRYRLPEAFDGGSDGDCSAPDAVEVVQRYGHLGIDNDLPTHQWLEGRPSTESAVALHPAVEWRRMTTPESADSTVELLARARSGDNRALETLFARHMPVLQRWASHRLPAHARQMADTCDLVQETVVQTFKNLEQFEYRGEGSLQAYMRQGFMNKLRDALRRLPRDTEQTDLGSDVRALGASPYEAALGAELLDTYEAALERLSPGDRQLIVSRVELGLSYREIAVDSGRRSPDAARMAVARALVRLAEEMKLP
jgi:RNA polymerase sigma-70 factor (ECF subfamily)